jgi:imidazole glycerol phosphate synthase glutamine amidotransferase subunit
MIVTLIDYGAGNVPSVERALFRLGAESRRASTAECINGAEALILPGVGHYSALIRALDERQMRAPLLQAIEKGVPFLGVCLGLQALYQRSEEAPDLAGLSLFPGRVSALPSQVKLPHMGWNQLQLKQNSRLLQNISHASYFYFAHSYAAPVDKQPDSCVATCTHGTEFTAVIEHRKLYAVQFHPEKSGSPGAQLLQNFLELAA